MHDSMLRDPIQGQGQSHDCLKATRGVDCHSRAGLIFTSVSSDSSLSLSVNLPHFFVPFFCALLVELYAVCVPCMPRGTVCYKATKHGLFCVVIWSVELMNVSFCCV